MQKMVRAAFGNNNIDTCARVCHSPTGYGLKQTFGTSAGTQDFQSVDHADVILRDRRESDRCTSGVRVATETTTYAKAPQLIVADPRRIDLVRSAHVEARHHLQLRPGTNVALINALAHVVVAEGLVDEAFVAAALRARVVRALARVHRRRGTLTGSGRAYTGVPADEVRSAARLYATARNATIYYGLGVTEHSQGSTMVMGLANLAMATGHIGRDGVGVNPLRGQNNVQGACDMGSFPHEFSGYRHISDAAVRASFDSKWHVQLDAEPGLRIPNMLAQAVGGEFRGLFVQGEDLAQSDPNTRTSPTRCARSTVSSCRICSTTRPRRSRTCSCRARRFWKKTARIRTRNGASTAYVP